ncbi:MAG: isoprenyl transferase [Pseudomonadota bacterium]
MNDAASSSLSLNSGNVPKHVAIIMDGNGRWAQHRGLPRTAGHRKGVEAVRRTVRAASDLGIEYLTLYSFSSENWNRPQAEISELFSLLRYFIRRDLAELHENNVCIKVIGERNGIPEDLLALLDEAQTLTKNNDAQKLVIAFNYGSRAEIIEAARKLAEKVAKGLFAPSEIDEQLFANSLDTSGIPDPDLLIRTSGEIRLSNFLLWQLAYTEFVFLDCLWPDFDKSDLQEAIEEFNGRTRKFGGLVRDTGS